MEPEWEEWRFKTRQASRRTAETVVTLGTGNIPTVWVNRRAKHVAYESWRFYISLSVKVIQWQK